MSNDQEFYRAVVDTLTHGEAVAIATVTKASGSVPRGVGSKMLVWRDGTIDGTVGGGTMEERVIQEAREAMVDAFAVLGDDSEVAREYRGKLANALF